MVEMQCTSFISWTVAELQANIVQMDTLNSKLSIRSQELSVSKQKYFLSLHCKDNDFKHT
ncbi:hypothetical protein X975_06861, partial [Stegodyphus mimosarum]